MPKLFKLLVVVTIIVGGITNCSEDAKSEIAGDLIDQWQITGIHNSSPSGPTLGPGTGEIISITLQADGKFSGSTSVNNFKGSYLADEVKLLLQGITTTEVAETSFGEAFYEALNESRNPVTGSSEFVIAFQNENTLHLEYLGFKFLILQKQ